MKRVRLWVFTAAALCANTSQAFYDSFQFSSASDQFELKKQSDGNFYLGETRVKLGAFNDFISLFGKKLEGSCPSLPAKPDVTITARRTVAGEFETTTQSTVRRFYISQKTVRDESGCAPIDGEGIFYLPSHRQWFTGDSQFSVTARSSWSIEKDGQTLASVTRRDGNWVAKESPNLNWDFFANFEKSLENFVITARLHPAIAEGKNSFKMKIDGRAYEGFLVAKNLWALKLPQTNWLVASESWSKWEDMRSELWTDRFADKIRTFSDTTLAPPQRIQAMESLGSHWSAGIKTALQGILKTEDEPLDVRLAALQRLRQRPTDDTFAVMIESLRTTEDKPLLIELTRNLRIKNPKGPLITNSSSEEEDQKAIRTWTDWWKTRAAK